MFDKEGLVETYFPKSVAFIQSYFLLVISLLYSLDFIPLEVLWTIMELALAKKPHLLVCCGTIVIGSPYYNGGVLSQLGVSPSDVGVFHVCSCVHPGCLACTRE